MSDKRFMRTQMLLGQEGIERLKQATVMIVGLGAVGGYALEALARSGIGHLILVDFDRFDETNINRQILALDSTIGLLKTEVAAVRVREINPLCRVEIKNVFVDKDNLADILAVRPDFVVDAIDSLGAKCALLEFLWREKIAFISSMGAALKTNPADIAISTLNKTQNCALARKVRHQLKEQGVNLAEVRCVYSKEQPKLPQTAILAPQKDDGVRHIMGSLPTITAIFGLILANEVILKLSKAEFKA